VQAELADYHDLMDRAAKVYEHITQGQVSKTNTLPEVVIALADDVMSKAINEAVSETTEELTAQLETCLAVCRNPQAFDLEQIAANVAALLGPQHGATK
jgi:hypothetical protein